MIIKFLKNNLRSRDKSPEYKQFRLKTKKQGNDLHHYIGSTLGNKKLNDYLLAEISAQLHTIITYQRRATETEQLIMLANCIEGLIDYVQHLEKDNDELRRIVKAAVETRQVIVELFKRNKNDTETKSA